MRNYIVYFLTTLFLLFVVESKINVKTLRNDYTSHTSQNLPKKANRLNQTYEKLSIQQNPDDIGNAYSLELTEDDFQLSDTFQTMVVFASIFTLIYIFGLKSFKKLKSAVHGCLSEYSSVKKFILIRSIRI
ncbi:hypothetical protein QX233_14725 [Chryseobacterium gambrini]|uniref:Uncharacterized protein n=1 Tax=Chryseobacterium gambrini TaxID=373672 RepID=A0AAJ1VND1_9FLAO|nr:MULTISPECIES: hypothetical protein [Chryseobacterium]MDN4013729.1 hypothetical protein [Chryseobacterium gambrini]MDN4031702.1 hypothetical protein [Chryseobacterium gambrini]QWA37917.1 hypothetical protein KKI44_18795 [Chryseobacterium sp. ZHDP1]